MRKFVLTEDFKKLNVGFALDEGMANPTEEFVLFYGERNIWRKQYYYKDHYSILSRHNTT
jgi:aminoacylase